MVDLQRVNILYMVITTHFFQGNAITKEEQKVCFELGIYHKNPYEHIFRHDELLEIIKNIKYIHIYGLSFSPVVWIFLTYILRSSIFCLLSKKEVFKISFLCEFFGNFNRFA